jgi:ribosomal protein S18 acetylase RimI-like enzyme/quinol monooxygenase YgiN
MKTQTIAPGAERGPWIPLLELADEPDPVRRYLHDGQLYGLVDDEERRIAAVLVVDIGDRAVELRAVAVDESVQGCGIGTRFLAELCDRFRAQGILRVVVGTASSGVRQLAFYQRLGFRLTHVERDFFSEARGYPPGLSENDIPVRDMVWMARGLDEARRPSKGDFMATSTVTVSLVVRLHAKGGMAEEVASFLAGAVDAANRETGTIAWLALRTDSTTFWIVDAFPSEAERQAHLQGPIAAALLANAERLLVAAPEILPATVLAAKLP